MSEREDLKLNNCTTYILSSSSTTMASKPGVLTDWPWKPLGSFKYVVLAPWAIYKTYSFMVMNGEDDRDLSSLLVLPVLLWRMLHNQIWISLSRYVTAKGRNRILDRGIEFDQVDREASWDDQIIFSGVILYLGIVLIPGATWLPMWRTDGMILTFLLHAGPVEFLYYWLHRALHHHYLYSRYHSHHHSSIVTEPITSVVHPFGEHIAYYVLFMIPIITSLLIGMGSIMSITIYITYIDLMNNMGHCNFELVPNWVFSYFPVLKFLMYTPSFHSLHHTQFRTNYSLFMPFYDYVYGTVDKASDELHNASLKRKEEWPDVVHLTHLTTPDSIYHLQLGIASLASKPHQSRWFFNWLLSPVTVWSMMVTWIYGQTFVVERHRFGKLKMQTWAVPKYSLQYGLQWQTKSINTMIEEAILDADEKGAKVITLGLLNQGEELNKYGEVYVKRNPKLKVKVVDGSSLAVAVILNSLPKHTSQVLLRGNLSKVAFATAFALSKQGIQVMMLNDQEYKKLSKSFNDPSKTNQLVFSKDHNFPDIWVVGDGLTEEEQLKAPKGTLFIPFSQFPPKKVRKDCLYHTTPAMVVPSPLENMHACENWLPRRVMSAWRVGGIIHALEGKKEHECGYSMSDIDQVWEASLRHGFQPLAAPSK